MVNLKLKKKVNSFFGKFSSIFLKVAFQKLPLIFCMKLLVGLGNPGKKYQATRHNVGFQLLEMLAQDLGLDFKGNKFEAQWAETAIQGEKTTLILPQTYMNRSGLSVSAFVNFFKIDLVDILVIHDEMDFSVGKMKFAHDGGAAGHRGVESIQEALGTQKFSRLRIGIGRPERKEQVPDFVLKPFQSEEKEILLPLLNRAKEALAIWVTSGLEAARSFLAKV